MSSIDHLPPELLIQVFLHLDLISIITLKRTCHFFHSIIENSEDVQYTLLLERSGMVSNPYSAQSIPSKRHDLQEKEDRWANLQWAGSFQKLAQPKTSLVCASSATALVVGTLGEGDSQDFTTGLQTLDDFVATSNEKLKGKKWTSTLPNMEILEYGLAVEADDLLIPVTWDIDETEWTLQGGFLVAHLAFLQHSTMLAHPEAGTASVRFSTLLDNEDSDDLFPFVRIEVCGDNVALTFVPTKPGSDGGLLFVFDWKAGRFKAERVPVSAEGIVFLRDDILINANAKDNSIDVYLIPPITENSENSTSLTMLRRFLLPSMHPTLTTTAGTGQCDQLSGCYAQCRLEQVARMAVADKVGFHS